MEDMGSAKGTSRPDYPSLSIQSTVRKRVGTPTASTSIGNPL